MDKILKQEVAKYLYDFLGNTVYHNDTYLNSLNKKYGKKTVLEAIKEIKENGSIKDALGE